MRRQLKTITRSVMTTERTITRSVMTMTTVPCAPSRGGRMINAKRLLFASIHSYLDPSSGAAMASREVLELLTARGWDCRVLGCGVLDYQHETPLDLALATLELPAARASALGSAGVGRPR